MTSISPSRKPYWLIGSIILNTLLAGLLIGGLMAVKSDKEARRSHVEFSDRVRAPQSDIRLSPENRNKVRETFRAAFRDSQVQRRAVRDAQTALNSALLAEPYDEEQVRMRLSGLAEAEAALQNRLHDFLAPELARMSLEQRRALIRNINRGRRRAVPARSLQKPDKAE